MTSGVKGGCRRVKGGKGGRRQVKGGGRRSELAAHDVCMWLGQERLGTAARD
jgi:hypothetical protein